jgi:hypothetical protein
MSDATGRRPIRRPAGVAGSDGRCCGRVDEIDEAGEHQPEDRVAMDLPSGRASPCAIGWWQPVLVLTSVVRDARLATSLRIDHRRTSWARYRLRPRQPTRGEGEQCRHARPRDRGRAD